MSKDDNGLAFTENEIILIKTGYDDPKPTAITVKELKVLMYERLGSDIANYHERISNAIRKNRMDEIHQMD